MGKVLEYVGLWHILKDRVRESWTGFWSDNRQQTTGSIDGQVGVGVGVDERESNFRERVKARCETLRTQSIRRIDRSSSQDQDYSHLTRSKTRRELLQISAAVMGIEFSYAAETAFVSPLLLNIGLRHRHMTLMWLFSPLVGLFVTPLLGSLSDGCRSSLGRRRPFILLLSIGIVCGLILVPNGKLLGRWFGDTFKEDGVPTNSTRIPQQILPEQNNLTFEETLARKRSDYFSSKAEQMPGNNLGGQDDSRTQFLKGLQAKGRFNPDKKGSLAKESLSEEGINYGKNETSEESDSQSTEIREIMGEILKKKRKIPEKVDQESETVKNHPWSLIFTVLGTILLDFDADACQSPARAYMLDVTIPEDHARGLSTFTVMAGLGGSLGYALGALNWENTWLGDFFGGQVRAVFTLVLFIFMGCVLATIQSFREIPLDKLWAAQGLKNAGSTGLGAGSGSRGDAKESPYARLEQDGVPPKTYGATELETHETSFGQENDPETTPTGSEGIPTFQEYLKTIVLLPKSLQWLCLTNFFCWMSLVCYSLYFTDFVGEAVFGGDPTAEPGSASRIAYDSGIRFGCWGMSFYSLSCSLYSLCIERLVARFGAKRVYITGQVIYSLGMICMALFRNRVGVIVFSWTAGIMYATLFTMPYLLVARYHAAETFDVDDDLEKTPAQRRGLGTDVAIVSSMVFLAQITQALLLGSVVAAVGSTTAIICAAAVFAGCGALSARKVLYLDL